LCAAPAMKKAGMNTARMPSMATNRGSVVSAVQAPEARRSGRPCSSKKQLGRSNHGAGIVRITGWLRRDVPGWLGAAHSSREVRRAESAANLRRGISGIIRCV
jgi:hypothetical protein